MASSKGDIACHAVVMTTGGVLVFSKYDRLITHHELYLQFKQLDIEVKDSFITEDEDFSLAEFLLSAISKWVKITYDDLLDQSSVCIQKASKKNQFVILQIQFKTADGTEVSVRPSEILCDNNHLLSDFS